MEDYRLVCGCIHAVTSEYGFKLAVGVNTVLHALAAGTVTITATTDYGITTSFVVTVTDPDFIIKPGDINDDGFTDIRDLVRFKKYLAGMITLSGRAFAAANLQPDQEINTQDMVRLRQLLLGME